jgi:hypothetical protein
MWILGINSAKNLDSNCELQGVSSKAQRSKGGQPRSTFMRGEIHSPGLSIVGGVDATDPCTLHGIRPTLTKSVFQKHLTVECA